VLYYRIQSRMSLFFSSFHVIYICKDEEKKNISSEDIFERTFLAVTVLPTQIYKTWRILQLDDLMNVIVRLIQFKNDQNKYLKPVDDEQKTSCKKGWILGILGYMHNKLEHTNVNKLLYQLINISRVFIQDQ
jgi:hypothetical protein